MAEPATPPPAETRAERHLRQLALLAERAVALACDLQEAALAAADPVEKTRYAQAFHHVSRTARQSIMIEDRLARAAARDDREAAARDADRAAQAVAVRKTRVQAGVERRIWRELDPDEAEAWTADLAERLDEDVLEPGFADETLDDHIDRAARELGLTGEGTNAYLPRALRREQWRRRAAVARWDALMADDDADDGEEDEDEPVEAAPAPVAPPPATPARKVKPAPPRDPDAFEPDFGPPPAPAAPVPSPPDPPPDPDPRPEPPPDPPPPPPDPPPEPYVPPWERAPPNAVYPGGSGY